MPELVSVISNSKVQDAHLYTVFMTSVGCDTVERPGTFIGKKKMITIDF